jgi:hypothetical protein
MDHSRTTSEDATARWRYGLWAVLGGFVAVAFCVTVALIRYDSAESGAAAVAPAIAAISALAGAYFGVQAGSSGKAEADAARDAAQLQALKLAAVADPDRALAVLGDLPAGPPNRGEPAADQKAAGHEEIRKLVDQGATDDAETNQSRPSRDAIGAKPASWSTAGATATLRHREEPEMPM